MPLKFVAQILVLSRFATGMWHDWVNQSGTTADDFATCARGDSAGDVIVTGRTAANFLGASAGGIDLFVVKLSSTGAYQWGVQKGTAEDEIVTAVEVDSSDNIFVAGFMRGQMDGQSNQGETDAFVIKFNSAGSWQWTVQRGGTSFDEIHELAIDSLDNLVSR